MALADGGILLILAALWGASFLFIRMAVPAMGPVALAEARVLLAALCLLASGLAVRRISGLRRDLRGYLVLGALSAALPFTLIAAAELRLTASLAAILNSTTPLFALLISAARLRERLSSRRLAGVLLGVAGVAVLVGWSPLRLDGGVLLATAASLGAALCYALGGIYARTRFPDTPPLVIATGQQLGAAALLAVPAVAALPRHPPGPGVALAVIALALVCTAVGFALFYRLISHLGPTGALTVTFLVPLFGLLWGALFLHEPLTWSTAAGMVLVLAAVALAAGTRRSRPANGRAGSPLARAAIQFPRRLWSGR